MVWRIIVVFGVLLGAMAGTLRAARDPEFSLPPPLLVLLDNQLLKVSVNGDQVLLFKPDKGAIETLKISKDNRTVDIMLEEYTHYSIYRVGFTRSHSSARLLFESTDRSYEFAPSEPYMVFLESPDGRWDFVEEHFDGSQYGLNQAAGWYIVDNFSQEKHLLLVGDSKYFPHATWTMDSQWVVLFFSRSKSVHNIFTYHVPSQTLTQIAEIDLFLGNDNYFQTALSNRTPAHANWSTDNQWIFYNTLTSGDFDGVLTFNIIHRDGDYHFRDLIHIVGTRRGMPLWVQWLPPEEPRESNWQFLLTVMLVIFVAGLGTRRLRLKRAF